MNTEDTAIPFKLSPLAEGDTPRRVVPHPTDEYLTRQAFLTDPATASDEESRVAAQRLAKEALTAHAIAEMPEDSFKTDEERYGAAAKMVELMTGEKDLDGRLWNGGKGFKTGADYLRSVKETLSRGIGAAADPDLQAWLRMTDEEKDAKIDAERGVLSYFGEAAGDVASGVGEAVRGVPQLSKDEYAAAPQEVREASDAMGSVMWDAFEEKERADAEAKVRDWRGGEWQRLKRRSEYEAKLRRKNALLYLPDMIKSLQGDDAKTLAGELSQNPSEIPNNWTERLKKLSTRDIETLAQIRGMTREHVEGGFFNWLGDMGIAAYNGAHGLLSGLGAQEAKIAAMAMGWDGERVNEMINRKHALWSAYAGWSSPAAQLSDEHGALANFTIGLASAVPFIASMHLKGLGYAACAGEMMSEADAQAAAAGIDTTNPLYCARNALAGGLYAYMLKAVSPKFLGASASGAAEEMALRTAFMKGVMSGVANLDALKVMSQRTASGALMMAMQQGVAAVNEDLNLGGDAWRDAAQRFTETFVSSIPDMLAFSAHGVLEGHARASGGWRKMFTAEGRANRSQNLREAVENAFAVRTAVAGNERIGELRANTMVAQLAAMRRAWTEGGEKGLERLGLKPEEIVEAKEFFEAERKAYGAAEKLDALDARLDEGMAQEEFDPYTFAERNAAARRFDEANGEYARAAERLAETLLGKTADAQGVVRDLEAVRNVWAKGRAVGAGKTKKDGTPDETDAGAAALVKAGFSPKDAAELSKAFGAERRGMYSPAATEALREMYTRSTRGMVEAHAALASVFGGKVRTENGRVLIDLPLPDGGTGTLAVETGYLDRDFFGAAGSAPEMAHQVELAVARQGGKIKAANWIAMTDAERRRIVNKYHLFEEGYFTLTDPADPSLHVSSGDADAVIGTIHLDTRADPGAGFHEAMHGFLRFCQETGFFDEADLKWLTEKYGAGTSKNSVRVRGEDGSVHLENRTEQLNEESAAEGFRQYLAKRMAGTITDEPGPFRKLFGLIWRIRHLREARAATERLAANAEEALYDAFLADKYRHIRDLKFAEPAAPKAEAGAGAEAPQTGAPPKDEALYDAFLADKYRHIRDLKFAEPAAPKAETGGETAAPQTGAPPKDEAKETKTTEATKETPPVASVPDVPSVPSTPRVVSFEALTPTGGKKVKGHYEIVPLASLLHSNKPGYPMELQQRDRRDNKGEEQTREEHIANFEAGYLLADPKTDSGAMVVARRPGPDGKPQLVVVSGNGRTMVLEEMAKRNLYDRYRNRMKEWAKENGVENAVADADNPVLVRVVDDPGGATLKELADLSNTNAIQQMNEEEQARADADLVRSLDLAKLYKPNMDGSANMSAGASDEFFRAFVRATGDTSLLNSDGTFTEALRMRARRALLAIACGQGERGRDVVKKLVEDTDALGIDRQKDTAAAIAPHVAAIEARPEYAIGPDVSRAFADYIEFRENRDTGKKWGTLEEYLKQGDMLDQRSEIAESVMRLLDDPKGAPVLAETVRLYVEAAKGETDGLFGAARTRAEIWRDAAKAVDEKAAQERARSEAAFKPETRFSIRSEEDGKKDEEKKETTAQGPLSKSDQTPPVQFSGGATSIPLTPESADPVTKFADSISQDGLKSPADFLTGLVHVLGSTETNPDKTQYFDIAHEDGRTMSLRVANHRATAGQYREHGNTAEVKTSIVVKMSDKPFKADADVELTEHVYFSDKLTAEREAGIASGVAEWIRTGEWHGPAADQVNMSPRRRYSISGIYTGTAADYANRSREGGKDDGPSLKKIGTGEGAQVYGWGLYGSNVPADRQIVRYSVTAQTETPQFKNFFGEWEKDPENASKVVDKDGRPLVVYRRDNEAFTVFDSTKTQQNDAGWLGKGFYFYGDKGEAERETGYGKNLRAFYLNIRNPYYITSEEYNKLVEADDPKVSRDFTESLKAEGYDGVYWNGDLRQEWAAFEPTQIKSATDNTGAFDPRNPDIRYSLKAGTATDYSWATLTAKPDMQLAQIDPEKFKNYKSDSERVKDAHNSVIAAGGEKVGKNYYIRMEGERVLVRNAGITHRGGKPNLANDFVYPVLGEVLKNAVRVNELEPDKATRPKYVTDMFVYLGALSYGQEILPVRIQVEHRGRERRIDRIDVLRSLNTKIGTVAALGGLAPATPVPGTAAAFGGLAPAYQPLPAISISNLIRIAQPLHPDIFSRDVAANLNVPYSGTKIGARYSVTAQASDQYSTVPERLSESLQRISFDTDTAADIAALRKVAERNIKAGADDTPSESEARSLKKRINEANARARARKKLADETSFEDLKKRYLDDEQYYREEAKELREQLKELERNGIGEDRDEVDWYTNGDLLEILDSIESGEASASMHFDPYAIGPGEAGPFAEALKNLADSGNFKGKDLERLDRLAKKINDAYKAIERDIEDPRGPFGESLRFSLVGRRPDGIEVFSTRSVDGMTNAERRDEFLRKLKEDYKGRTARFTVDGRTYYATFGDDDVGKLVYGDNKTSTRNKKVKDRIGAAGDFFDLVENARYRKTANESGKESDSHKDVESWDYFAKTVQVDSGMYDVHIEVRRKTSRTGQLKDEFIYNVYLNRSKKKPDHSFLARAEAMSGNPVVRGDDATALGSKKSDAESVPKPSDEIKADPESFARRSVVSRVIDGDAEERESALVAFVAERALRHGPKPKIGSTIGRLGLEMGLKIVDASRIVQKGEALADRVRGTVIEKAIRNGYVATATALLAREADIDRLVAGAAGQGGQLVRYGEGKIKSILEREIEKTVRSFNAASLADIERDTGIDIADEILHNSPEKFDPKGAAKAAERKGEAEAAGGEEGSAPGESLPEEGNLSDWEVARRERVRKAAEERVARMIATAKERVEAAKKEREEWEAKKNEQRKANSEQVEGDKGGGDNSSLSTDTSSLDAERPKLSTWADFKTPEEFAAFFRVWAEDRYKKEHGASTLGKHEEKRLFPEFYRKAVVKELQDLADKLLPPKGARATVNRWLGEIQPGVRPDTLERVSADVFAYINRNAIRESRTAQIQQFRNALQEFLKGPQFDDLKLDADRKVTGWVEEAARYIRRVCNLSIRSINGEPSQLEKERAELQAILDRRAQVYDDEGKNAADAPKFDMETRRALAKLQLLEKCGAMKRYMPGEIADLADEAMRWLQDEAVKLEAAWKEARDAEESIRSALTAGIVGPNGQRYKRGTGVKAWFDGLFDSLNGMIRLRLQHLVRFADAAHQQKAKDAINRVVVMLGDGETAFARQLQDDRMAFHKALAQIFATPDGKGVDRRALADWLNRMTEAIPADLSRQLSRQGYGDSMTYGQMLQLLVSLEQKSYAEAIKENKRDWQADLIRTFEMVGPEGRRERVLTDKDILFIDWLRSFYEAKRGMLSEVTKRMTGLPVDSPDPLYCPVKMYMGDQARGMHVDDSAAWDPIGAVFSRRVETLRDFDESASILGQFFDRSAASANLVAWGERGAIIRGVFTNASVQESIRRAFGGGELTKILKQLEETFNGGENIKKSPGEIAAADKAMNWMTYLSLGYNPLSAMKQTTSFTVWANALPGGFKDLWRYMTDVDMDTIRHIKESEEFKVRYGNEVGSGHDVASKGLFENPSENPVAAFFRKTSMGLLRKGDFLPGGWIAQGVFRDLYNRHLKEGMDADAADKLAMTETFNMLEETQQSGRTYNTAELAREHGRLGRLLVQFATSPLQQLQYETQAAREVWDLQRYKPTTPDADFEKRYAEAKGRLIRAAVINHVLLPAALHAVTDIYRLAMGYDPEWEKEGWHWSLLRDITLGQFSRVFFIGAISSVTTDVLITGKPVREIPALIPAEGVVKLFANITVTARDVATLNYDRLKKDLDRLLKSTSITRTPYDVGRLVTGKAYAEREERREKRRKKEAQKK